MGGGILAGMLAFHAPMKMSFRTRVASAASRLGGIFMHLFVVLTGIWNKLHNDPSALRVFGMTGLEWVVESLQACWTSTHH